MTDGEPETAFSASLLKIKSLKTNINFFSFFFLLLFYYIKSQTSDSFVFHFDGHFAYLKILDFSFNIKRQKTVFDFVSKDVVLSSVRGLVGVNSK